MLPVLISGQSAGAIGITGSAPLVIGGGVVGAGVPAIPPGGGVVGGVAGGGVVGGTLGPAPRPAAPLGAGVPARPEGGVTTFGGGVVMPAGEPAKPLEPVPALLGGVTGALLGKGCCPSSAEQATRQDRMVIATSARAMTNLIERPCRCQLQAISIDIEGKSQR